jgi:hypothetical protein
MLKQVKLIVTLLTLAVSVARAGSIFDAEDSSTHPIAPATQPIQSLSQAPSATQATTHPSAEFPAEQKRNAAARKATTQPDDQLSQLERNNAILRAEVAELIQEVTALKAQLHPQPKKIADASGRPLQSFDQIIGMIPAEDFPPKGRDWDAQFLPRANSWLDDNIVGRVIKVRVQFVGLRQIGQAEPDVLFLVPDFRHKDLPMTVSLSGSFDPDDLKALASVTEYQLIRLTGKIKTIEMNGSRGQMQLMINLSHCQIER